MTTPTTGAGRDRSIAHERAWLAAMPAVFVLIWSTGFIVARYGMPHAGPMMFLAWRYLLSIAAFALWIALTRAAWPRGRAQWLHLAVTGVLMHALYLGGVWAAVKAGIGAGTSALVVGFQPVLTAIWVSAVAGAASEHRVAPRQWLGLALGLAGLTLVVWRKLGAGEITVFNFSLCLLALLAITTGTLYQKRFVAPCDVRTANTVQLLAALAVTAPLAWFEDAPIVWHAQLFGAMAWSPPDRPAGSAGPRCAGRSRGPGAPVPGWQWPRAPAS